MAVYGPVRHPKNIVWTSEASVASEVHIIFFWWRTGPYTAIWPSVPWTICYIRQDFVLIQVLVCDAVHCNKLDKDSYISTNNFLIWTWEGQGFKNKIKLTWWGGGTIICLTPPYSVPVPSQDLDFHRQISWSFYVQRYEVRGSCTFCWYCWNCWSSLFKLSFHNYIEPGWLNELGSWIT